MRTDADDFRFLSRADAVVRVQLNPAEPPPSLLVSGNRAGLLALANVLLWLVGNSFRREILSLAELPFVRLDGSLHVVLRVGYGDATGRDGVISRPDGQEQYEWEIAEDDLQRVALIIHRIVAEPGREYYRAIIVDASDGGIEFRMLDVVDWL